MRNKENVKMTPVRTLAFASLAVIASMGAASAAQMQLVSRDGYSFAGNPAVAGAPVSWTGPYYGHSGSIGRLNFGASPRHPEGPGNFSD